MFFIRRGESRLVWSGSVYHQKIQRRYAAPEKRGKEQPVKTHIQNQSRLHF